MLAMLLHDGPHGEGFLTGLLHPLTGLDHWTIALVAGVLAAQLPRAARLLLLAAFVPAWLALHPGGEDAMFVAGSALTTLALCGVGLALGLRLRAAAQPSA